MTSQMDVSALAIENGLLARAIERVDLGGARRPTCDEYALLFGRRRGESGELDDAMTFLAIICGWRLRPDQSESPFDALPGAPTWREVTEGQVEAMGEAGQRVTDPELRARLCDLVWLLKRDHRSARTAAEDYAASAERLIRSEHYLGERERLRRAVALALALGRNGEAFKNVADRISAIARDAATKHVALTDCLGVLQETRAGSAAELYGLAVARARSLADASPNPVWERRFWDLAAGFAGQNKDTDGQNAALREVALTFENEARAAPMQAVAAQWWEGALRTYRKIPGSEGDRTRVHQELLKAQQHIREEMIPLEIEPFDVSEQVIGARSRVQGKDKMRALVELACATEWPAKAEMRRQAEDLIRRHPLLHMFSSVRFGSTWKVAATAPGTAPDPAEIAEERLLAEMAQQYRYLIPIAAHGTIEPMRHEVLLAHNVTLDDVAQLVHYSSVVPPGREAFFTIGIHAGLHGRFIEALHVLVPQLEHMLRCALEVRNVVTSRINDAGIQEEFDLNRLLSMPETEGALGEDLHFVIRVLFTDRYGYNLRNELSHGMRSPGAFFTEEAVYAWWLVFRVVATRVAEAVVRAEREGGGGEPE